LSDPGVVEPASAPYDREDANFLNPDLAGPIIVKINHMTFVMNEGRLKLYIRE
jgi:hypothetical protein